MKKLYLILFLVFTSLHASAQKLIVDWTRFIGGDSCFTVCHKAIPTNDGGIIITGQAYNHTTNASGDMPPFPYKEENVFVAKMDNVGHLSWVKIFGGSKHDAGYSICPTPDGGYAILATTQSTDGDSPGLVGGIDERDVWLIKLDANGNKLWSKTYGGPGDNEALSISVTPDGGFIILGAATVAGNDIPFHYTSSPFLFDWFVMKTDANGNKQWLKVYGGDGDEEAVGSLLVVNNAYYLVSTSSSKDHDCQDVSWHSASANTLSDVYILKLDTSGNILWGKSYGGSSWEMVYGAFYDEVDNTIVLASTSYSNDYLAQGNHGGHDCWIIKVNSEGEYKWGKMIGGEKDEYRPSILKYNNNYLINVQSNSTNLGGLDNWLHVVDTIGNIITSKVFGSAQNDQGTSLLPFQNYFALTGHTATNKFNEGTNISINNAGGAFITKLEYFPTSISAIDDSYQTLQLYPNPSQQNTRLVFPAAGKQSELTITDSKGVVVVRQTIKPNTTYLDIEIDKWPAGIYLASYCAADGDVVSAKFVKE